MLHKFYAVTYTSVYLVKDKDEDGRPAAVKIALRGESNLPIGHRLRGGSMIAICYRLIAYSPEGNREIEKINTFYWGDSTSRIVALFKTEEEARICFASNNLKSCDPRWINETREVLREIGEDHPVFYVAKTPRYALIATPQLEQSEC